MEAPAEVEWSTAGKWCRRPAKPAAVLTGSASPTPSLKSSAAEILPPGQRKPAAGIPRKGASYPLAKLAWIRCCR
ncbi:TPA: hypothetical protein MG828_21700 [Klebsiella pneumoniae]|nr:hypothetical protein C0078_12185 [Klebsiella pneumoniae]AZB76701.1 hypothetical protein EG819_11475 [Klebsiella pneumoniae subsp. pneumoniae]AXS18023.1 hypothetical protein D0887_05550 [Klebsiella pneumoniae]EIW9231991.1 hypothetical protein [Klebsiella pneumoniae]KAA1535816.1 hypothetical protein F1D28_15760 [Klebsiella pneumoniae]